jgi:hypothetical protein
LIGALKRTLARVVAERLELLAEGIVSKRRDAPYRSGKQCGEANKERWRLFERDR